jgi:hypothetical protein
LRSKLLSNAAAQSCLKNTVAQSCSKYAVAQSCLKNAVAQSCFKNAQTTATTETVMQFMLLYNVYVILPIYSTQYSNWGTCFFGTLKGDILFHLRFVNTQG